MDGFRNKAKTTYVNVIGGKFRIRAEKNAQGSLKRIVTDREGKPIGEKWEYVYDELVCFIKDISAYDGKFGRETHVICDTHAGEVKLQLSQGSKYASDFLKRVPNVDFSKKVVLSPFDFDNDKGNKVQGILIYQDGKKILSYYKDEDGNNINGIPTLSAEQYEEKKGSKTFWKYWFGEEYEFLLKEATKLNCDVPRKENPLSNKVEKPTVDETLKMHESVNEDNPDLVEDLDLESDNDLPF